MIVKVIGVPTQPLADGVTTTVETTGAVPLLTAVNDGIFPFPLAARPIAGVVFVQAKVVPLTVPPKLIADVADPVP